MTRLTIVLLLVGAVTLLAAPPALGQTPPSCVLPEPTPAPGSPAAPSSVHMESLSLAWTDNSDDESGFLICINIDRGGPTTVNFEFVAPANVTRFLLPSDAQPGCPDNGVGVWGVSAFNDQGISNSEGLVLLGECIPPTLTPPPTVAPTPTSQPMLSPTDQTDPAALPAAGGAQGGMGSAPLGLWGLLTASLASLLAAGVLRWTRPDRR